MGEKISCLLDKKMRRKNQISEYDISSAKKYNEEDIRSINEKHPKLIGVLRKKTEKSIKCDW